jgi:hypothetical protein
MPPKTLAPKLLRLISIFVMLSALAPGDPSLTKAEGPANVLNASKDTKEHISPQTPEGIASIGTTTRISVNDSGEQGNSASWAWAISSDGRFVAFRSGASNLVGNDTNDSWDIFVYDRQTEQVERVSVASDGTQGNDTSYHPSISADGRFVAFASAADNLVSSDTNSSLDVFVHDRYAGQTTRVSIASDGSQGDSWSGLWTAISAEGRYVAFISSASNLVSGDTNSALDVFVHDRYTNQTTRVSVASDAAQGNGDSGWAASSYGGISISADGRFVTFESDASNLVTNDTNGVTDAFVHDRQTQQTTRVSVATNGTQGDEQSGAPCISANGRYVAFHSIASNLVFDDFNNVYDIFVHDRQTGRTELASIASSGKRAYMSSSYPAISEDGRFIAFTSQAINLVFDDTNNAGDVFVRDRQNAQTLRVSVASDGTQGDATSGEYGLTAISADGRFVAFDSDATNLVSGDTNGFTDVFVHERDTEIMYVGPPYLPKSTVMPDEVDDRITMGDHVHLQLPFKNTGNQVINDASVRITGSPQSDNQGGVSIYNGTSWQETNQSVTLTPATLNPGAIGTADFWIYVTNNDIADRSSRTGKAWLQVQTSGGEWTLNIQLEPPTFDIVGYAYMKNGSCLHMPNNYAIRQYAQYAAGNSTRRTPPSNAQDPDTPLQAVHNLVNHVNGDFEYAHEGESTRHDDERLADLILLTRRGGFIGVCRHYADLTIGLLRALGLPARYTSGTFKFADSKKDSTAHAWVEVYLGGVKGWTHADSTWNIVDQPYVYEYTATYSELKDVYADLYPLSSASMWSMKELQCIPACYEEPVDCYDCQKKSNNRFRLTLFPDLTCVYDVTWRYHIGTKMMSTRAPSTDERLLVQLQAPTSVTRTVPFTLASGIVNSTTVPLAPITATVVISEYADSITPMFDVDPRYQTIGTLNPGESVTVTWTVTPLVTRRGAPLQVTAESGDFFEMSGQPLVVNEPGTLPDLSLGGLCGLDTVSPGEAITLTAYVLDNTLSPLTDTSTLITATVYATPTLAFSTTTTLSYCLPCETYQVALTLPYTTPIGSYQVDFIATHPGYDPDSATSLFLVTPPLSLTLGTSRNVLELHDYLALEARVWERSTVITDANVWIEIDSPTGVVTTPLMMESDSITYTLILRPIDLDANLEEQAMPGVWNIRAMADYQGSVTTEKRNIEVQGAPDSMTFTGPTSGVTGNRYTFVASPSPRASTPVTYTWQATGQAPVAHPNSGLSDTVAFSWATPGPQVLTVTVANVAGMATHTHGLIISAPPTKITTSGPKTGVIGDDYTFAASVEPTTTTIPVTFTWRAAGQTPMIHLNSGLSDTATFSWTTPGPQILTVTVANAAGTVTHARLITISAPPVKMDISGPKTGIVGDDYAFVASVNPTATQPITYVWQTGQQTLIEYGKAGVSSSASFSWTVTGVQNLIVTATNTVGRITGTHTITINPAANVSISGESRASTNTPITFTAMFTQGTAILPVLYTWEATEQEPIAQETSHLTSRVTFTWTIPGNKMLTVTVGRAGAANVIYAQAAHPIDIEKGKYAIYLPLVLRNK